MLFRQWEDRLEVLAPAKLNLFLEITGKRDDGFHELDMLMVPIAFYDSLTFSWRSADELTLTANWALASCCKTRLPAAEDNLVMRALQLLQQKLKSQHPRFSQGLHVDLIKRIPVAAGLGGASTDAAAALLAANYLWQAGLGKKELAEIALQVGSDVPFFLSASGARCRGRGELIERVDAGVALDVVLVKPPIGLATSAVFSQVSIDPDSPAVAIHELLAAYQRGRPREIGQHLHNRLFDSAVQLEPQLEKLKTDLVALNLPGVQMSGSGSTFYLLCQHALQAQTVARRLSSQGCGAVIQTRTIPGQMFSQIGFGQPAAPIRPMQA